MKAEAVEILVVEDVPEIASIFEAALQQAGYKVRLARNGREAQEALQQHFYPVVITDLMMPEMDGQALIDWMVRAEIRPQIIVITSVDEIDTVVEVIRKGVLDYVVKPVHTDDLLIKVERALERSRLLTLEQTVEEERRIRLQRQLEWTLWKQNIQQRAQDNLNRNLFNSLRTNFSQGAGFGVLLSLLSVVTQTAVETKDGYLIDEETMELLKENTEYAGRSLRQFQEIDSVISGSTELHCHTIQQIHSMMVDWIAEMESLAGLRGHTVVLSDPGTGFDGVCVEINAEQIKNAIVEVLTNALKFSPAETDVLVLLKKGRDKLFLSVMNQPLEKTEVVGIPPEYENLVFEPFFRINRTVQEMYDTLDSGLGLTLVQKIVNNHNGSVSLFNINDHVDEGIRVNAEIQLPLSPLR
ncbi:MAG: response regulator [Leptospiraceae bacterium]|nr:response regulator [Leptospiraceae bacterium]